MQLLATLIEAGIFAIAFVAFTVSAVRDLILHAPFGSTMRSWLRRVADVFFSIP